jgi:hypothetical protein
LCDERVNEVCIRVTDRREKITLRLGFVSQIRRRKRARGLMMAAQVTGARDDQRVRICDRTSTDVGTQGLVQSDDVGATSVEQRFRRARSESGHTDDALNRLIRRELVLGLGTTMVARATAVAVEYRLGRLAGDHRISDGVGVLLVGVAFLADVALERHTGALLDDVRGFVRRGVEIRLTGERDVVARCVRLRAHGSRALGGLPADVGLDVADVVTAERALDDIVMRQRTAGSLSAVRRGGVHVAGFGARLAFRLALDRCGHRATAIDVKLGGGCCVRLRRVAA